MAPMMPASPSPIRLFFWRMAVLVTDAALRNRANMATAWPYLQLVGGGLLAYLVGRLFGAWALSAVIP